jgi:hypothetical protein
MELSNQLHTSASNLLYSFSSRLGGPQSQSGCFGKTKIFYPIENQSLGGGGEGTNVFIHLAPSFLISTADDRTLFTGNLHATYTLDQYSTRHVHS